MPETVIWAIIGGVILIIVIAGFYTVGQQTTAVVERFGKFARLATPGLNYRIPIIERVAGTVSLRVS